MSGRLMPSARSAISSWNQIEGARPLFYVRRRRPATHDELIYVANKNTMDIIDPTLPGRHGKKATQYIINQTES
jgi:hypothetical protein